MKTFVKSVGLDRSRWTAASVSASVCLFVCSSSGTVLIHEPFDYVSGELDAGVRKSVDGGKLGWQQPRPGDTPAAL